jgi:rod shape-determining protein MreC
MLRYLLRNKRPFILIILVILAFLWMSLQVRNEGPGLIGRFTNTILSPLQKGILWMAKGIERGWSHYIFLVGTAKENERLNSEIEGFKKERHMAIEALEENKRLRTILSLSRSQPNYVATAEVIGRDPTNWFRTVLIDKGERDGIRKDMVAITTAGLVGRIYQVMNSSSRVLLITDRGSSVASRIQRTRSEGILEGRGIHCLLRYIPSSEELRVGDVVLSSGLDGIFPEDLLIGTVSMVKPKGSGLFQEVEVMPAARIERLEEITVLVRR